MACTLKLTAKECDISIINNTSYIDLKISATTSGETWNATGDAYVNATAVAQNNTISIPKTNFTIGKNTTKTIYSGKLGPFKHNVDGSLNTVTINANAYLTSVTKPTAKVTCNMSKIARASTISATNTIIGNVCTIKIARADTKLTHDLTYKVGTTTGTIATGVATNYNWTVPTSFYNKIPNASSGVCTITCTTKSGTTIVGSTTKNITFLCNASICKPSLNVKVEDINQNTINLTGSNEKLIKYFSTVKVSPTASAKNGANISKITINGTTANTLNISKVTTNSFTVIATDSRGFSTTVVKTLPMINYVPITCNAKFKRRSQTSNIIDLNLSGNYFEGDFGISDNILELTYKYREKGSTTWFDGVESIPIIENGKYSLNLSCGAIFDYQKNYEFIVYFKDKLINTNTSAIIVTKGIPVIAIFQKAIMFNGKVIHS